MLHFSCSRRQVLKSLACGFGYLALADLAHASANPLAPRRPHHLPKAMRVIFIFMQGGPSHGGTDDFGHRAVHGKVHMHDLHATLLHLLGLDHERLTYRFDGRNFRLTDVQREVISEILA